MATDPSVSVTFGVLVEQPADFFLYIIDSLAIWLHSAAFAYSAAATAALFDGQPYGREQAEYDHCARENEHLPLLGCVGLSLLVELLLLC